jgi:hypothetical protein
MRIRSQSAIEFLTTYGVVFLILAIVISGIIVLVRAPNYILPNECTIYSGLRCVDATFVTNSQESAIIVLVVNSEPGVVNISSFNSVLGFQNSTSSFCSVPYLKDGAESYCVAVFNSPVTSGTTYSGTLSIKANYCATGISTLSTASCPAKTTYVYDGNVRAQSTPVPVVPLSSSGIVKILIQNTQSVATQNPFDEMVTFSPFTYLLYEKSDLGDIRFYAGRVSTANELYSWCESGCTSNSLSARFWVRIPSNIPANSNMIINMSFGNTLTDYDGVYAGEAPQLTCSNANTMICGPGKTYGQFDNGANVFTKYQNFAGFSYPSGWSQSSGGVAFVSNGLYLTAVSGDFVYINSPWVQPNPDSSNILDAYVSMTGTPAGAGDLGFGYDTNYLFNNGAFWSTTTSGTISDYIWPTAGALTPSEGAFHVESIWWSGASAATFTSDYGSADSRSGSVGSTNTNTVQFVEWGQGTGNVLSAYWARLRPSSPNGIMPSATMPALPNYVQITLTNSQSSNTPTPFQQYITFNPSSYKQYEGSNLGNIRFYQGPVGTNELYSWCESGCTNTSTSAVFWISLPHGVPFGSANAVLVNMTFTLPHSTQYSSPCSGLCFTPGYAGEAPQLTCSNANTMICGSGQTYAQYDNGGSVFPFYDDFDYSANFIAGTSHSWTTDASAGVLKTVMAENGLLYSSNSINLNNLGNSYTYTTGSNMVMDEDLDAITSGSTGNTGSQGLGVGVTTGYPANSVGFVLYGSGDEYAIFGSGATAVGGTIAYNTSQILTGYVANGVGCTMFVNYVSKVTGCSTLPGNAIGSTVAAAFAITQGDGAGAGSIETGFTQWVRARAYPPSGVMPTASYGAVV